MSALGLYALFGAPLLLFCTGCAAVLLANWQDERYAKRLRAK